MKRSQYTTTMVNAIASLNGAYAPASPKETLHLKGAVSLQVGEPAQRGRGANPLGLHRFLDAVNS